MDHIGKVADTLVGMNEVSHALNSAAGVLAHHTHAQDAHAVIVGNNDLKKAGGFAHGNGARREKRAEEIIATLEAIDGQPSTFDVVAGGGASGSIVIVLSFRSSAALAAEMAQGDYSRRVRATSWDEVGELGDRPRRSRRRNSEPRRRSRPSRAS